MKEEPVGWATAKLGDLVTVIRGVTYSKRDATDTARPGAVPVLRANNITEHGLTNIDLVFVPSTCVAPEQLLLPGDVVMAASSGSRTVVGKSASALGHPRLGEISFGAFCYAVRPHREVNPSFVSYFMRSPGCRRRISEAAAGVNIHNLRRDHVEGQPLGIPPQNEQQRIVAKLDAVFEQTRAAKARLERLPTLLEKLKRSILAAAFRGDLTKDWRAANPNVEPASALLDRVQTQRRRHWENGLRAKGKDPAKATYDAPRTELTGDLPTLPAAWSWTRADAVVAPDTIITYGIVLPGTHIEGGVPYVRQQDIRDGRIDVGALLRTTPEIAGKHDRSTLQTGDVLLCIIRHRRVAIVPAGLDGANITQGTVRFRPCDEIEGAYLAAWLESPVAQSWMETRVFGLDMPRINVSDTREIPIPLPPRDEQLRIVQLLAMTMARLATIGDAQRTAESRTLALEQAALAKAFRGELVPQDPNDEPAPALLERIRAARAAEPMARRRGRADRASEPAPAAAEPTNGLPTAQRDDPLDLVIAAFQQGEPRLAATAITQATGLDAVTVKRALATLVDGGQVRVHGRARGTTYEWAT